MPRYEPLGKRFMRYRPCRTGRSQKTPRNRAEAGDLSCPPDGPAADKRDSQPAAIPLCRLAHQDAAAKTDKIIGPVFHRNGKAIRDFRGTWEKACEAAGVQGRLVHDFRRTAVRNLERAGVPRSVAMKLTGHKTETVYRGYAIVSPADLKAGVEKLAKLHVEQSQPAKVVVVLADRKTRT
jgi:Phage integrase family